MRWFIVMTGIVLGLFVSTTTAFAHAGVQQKEAGIGSIQTFTFGVPNEKEAAATTGVRILIPEGVQDVLPNVKSGWTVSVKKSDDGDDARTTEIVWSGGNIPPGQRDEVSLTARVPSEETTLIWKAYQTYSDGETVAWDTDPATIAAEAKEQGQTPTNHDETGKKPYSTTKVINDLTDADAQAASDIQPGSNLPMIVASLALAASLVSLGMQFMKKKK